MNDATIRAAAIVFAAGLSGAVFGQQVYRCELADGSTTYSDLPCESDIGREDTVDVTPHQGHRAAPEPSTREANRRVLESPGAGGGTPPQRAAKSEPASSPLPRRQRLSLERERKQLLSGLKRRHVEAAERRAMIAELREIDRKLGIGPGDVADMPFHNREVYVDHAVYPGAVAAPGNGGR